MRSRTTTRLLACLCLAMALPSLSGCNIVGYFMSNVLRSGQSAKKLQKAEYTGLDGKDFAVMIAADRAIQAQVPSVVPLLTLKISNRLRDETEATGFIMPGDVLRYQYVNPSWSARAYGDLAEELGVDRLIIIDLQEFRLNDPGNPHLWEGTAAGTVAVIERDATQPDDIAFQKTIRVNFPDQRGLGPGNLSGDQMIAVLAQRFTDRASWLFYDAMVPGDINY